MQIQSNSTPYRLDEKEREAVETMIAGVLYMHNAKRWTQAAVAAPAAKSKPKASTGRA